MEHNIEEFLNHTQLIIVDAENALRDSPNDRNIFEYYEQRLDFLIDTLVRLLQHHRLHNVQGLQAILHQLRMTRRFLLNALERIDNTGVIYPDTTSQVATGGRPLINIDADIITFLRELNFSWVQIASIIGVHSRTLYRRRQELQIEDTQGSFSDITDADLDDLVKSLKDIQPNTGVTLLQGFLSAQGYRIQRARIRASSRRIDPLANNVRWIYAREVRR